MPPLGVLCVLAVKFMRLRPLILFLLGLLVLAGVWFFWPAGPRPSAQKNKTATPAVIAPNFTSSKSASTAPVLFATKTATNAPVAKTNQFAWRLTNTPKKIGELTKDPHAILLANAFIDTGAKLNLAIPRHLQSPGDPGAYIVQARGPVDGAFRAALAAAGAQVVSYIPNNAYLVRISSGGAAGLAGQPPVQSVIPYEPYYKISGELIGAAAQQQALPGDAVLTLGLFADDAAVTTDQIKNLGGTVVGTDRSPFGPIVRVTPPANWTALATLPGVQIVELGHHRAPANDLARVTLGISTDTVTNANYMGLNGQGVVVEVNDTGVDQTHPDFSLNETAENPGAAAIPPGSGRVTGSPLSLVDTNGHGTHVAGIIAGNGWASYSVTNIPQGSVTNADFRGKAPLATLYSFAALDDTGSLDIPDYDLQSVPATNHALISNNSWVYNDSTYDLAAASYDAAVRDALPLVTGSQPVLFVFAAGNDGGGDDNGGGGDPDTILSPGTAKDVITVGALEQLRSITNSVTNLDGTVSTPWEDGTSSDNEVAGYSARGNVGIGTEGDFGRFKPDVVAPGSFVVSTRSSEWDQLAYYNPTNTTFNGYFGQLVDPNTLNYYAITVPANAVGVNIYIVPNAASSSPFPTNLPIYVSKTGFPTTTVNDFVTDNNQVSIPPNSGGAITGIQSIQNGTFNFAVGNNTNSPVNYDIITSITTTNDLGNYYQVLSNLNGTLAPWYRYESGTSMATPAVSGLLALLQDYFTNDLRATTPPSPALLKAMVINGARSQGSYGFAVTNILNLQGWGLPDLTNSLPYGLTNSYSAPCASFFLDQSPTNALATGDSQTFIVNLETADFAAQAQPLRVTLAWTDPPGNPAAAIKLVNSLELVVTNLDSTDPNYLSVYYGNDFDPANPSFSEPWDTNTVPNIDFVNNVQNVFLPALFEPLGLEYSVTVIGRSVNVNAVTAQSNNVVQDFALVISSGDGEVTNAITVMPPASNPFIGPQVTFVSIGNSLLTNQFAGGNTPLLGTNTVGAGPGYITNAAITLGMTNQWHFYVVTNTFGYTNAAFITFLSQTLATPRMGVFADAAQNPTQPEADIDLYVASVTTDPTAYTLTNLNPVVISNCVNGLNGDGASLGNGTGTEFVAYSNSVPDGIYIIGVKSETQEAAEYDFLPVFSQLPFSQMNPDGSETVNGLLLPVNIPDGTPAHPGINYVFALAVQPIQVQDIIVSNTFFSQNFGDLTGLFSHGGKSVVLNNHDSPVPTVPPDIFSFVYDDSPTPIPGSQPPDGPGSLNNFQGQQGIGPWILTEADNAHTQTSSVTSLTLLIRPHIPLGNTGVNISIAPMSWFYGFIDVPAGATNLTVAATNVLSVPGSPPLQLYVKLGDYPSLTNFDKTEGLTNGVPPGGSISIGPSDLPPIQPGRYFVGIYNGSGTVYNDVFVIATISLGQIAPIDFNATGPTNLLDDAVMYSSVFVTNTLPIATVSVGLRVDHPRISDLVFHLISPDGTRYLLMENRGAESTNGCGVTIYTTNIVNVASSGGSGANTNYVNVGENTGTLTINYNFYTAPDQMTVYASTNPADFYLASPTLLLDTGLTSGSSQLNLPFTTTSGYLTIIMNEFGNPDPNTLWTYSAGGVQTNYYYLVLTQDTNLTTTPIKFAPPPFVPAGFYSTNFGFGDFESATPGDYTGPIAGSSWSVISNQVSLVNDPATAYQGTQFVALANGVISNNIPTVPGGKYTLTYAYRGPGITTFWRGESNYLDSINGDNATVSTGAVTFVTAEVGSGLNFNTGANGLSVPNSANFNFGAGQDFSIDAWIKMPPGAGSGNSLGLMDIVDNRYIPPPYPDLLYSLGYALFLNSGHLGCQLSQAPVGTFSNFVSTSPDLRDGKFHHVALTVSRNSSMGGNFYVDGASAGTFNPTGEAGDLSTLQPLLIGNHPDLGIYGYFDGVIDELSIYRRALSASEVKAIYTNGAAGKFNATSAFPQNLAEASIAIPGAGTDLIYGDNTNWQQQAISFTATGTSTPVVISGLEPGMLLDSFAVSGEGGGGNLYYLPEQSLDPLVGTSPYGTWQLEIQDDRVGATNDTVLDSWQLQFVFDDTNQVPAEVGPGVTNSIPPGETFWVEVDVPTNADFATNILTFATGPLNMWYSTNLPPTTTNPPGDVQLLSSATSGSALLGTNGYPDIIPGGIYYIGLQNPGAVTVDFGFRVDFHLVDLMLLLPAQPSLIMNELTTVVVTNTAIVNYPNPQLTYALFNPPSWASINTNGIITLKPGEVDGPGVYNITTVVHDSSTGFSATNSFTVTVNEVNTPPYFLLTPPDQYINVNSKLVVTNMAADSDIPVNLLIYSLVGAPAGMSINPVHGVITWKPTAAQAPSTNLITTVVTDTNPPAVNAKSLSATNYFTVYVASPTEPFAFTEPATQATGASAQLNGMATPNGFPTTAWFQWGTSQAYGNNTTPVDVGASFNVVFVSTNISGLTTNFAFHYRLVVSNLVGVAYGFDQIFDQGNLVAWGADFEGQTTPIPPGLTNLVAGVGAGYDYSLALNYDGTVVVWGDNSQGQANVPAGLDNAVAVAGGMGDSLALRSDRTVTVWGSNVYGQTNVPPDLTNAVAAASGSYHCLALRDNGDPVAWGSDDHFQTNVPAGLNNVVAVAAGEFHSLALKNDGTVVAWGNNADGETNVPAGLTNVVAIAAGYSHNLALRNDGTVVAWGFNGNGQTNVPFGLTNVMAIAAGGYHCQALRTDGSVVFWGDSGAGQTNFTPPNLANVFTIVGGGFHTVAVSALYGLSVTNTPPYWTNNLDSTTITMSVLTTKVINNSALDSNAPPQLVFYSFVNNPPSFASIDAFTGIITLSPQASDGPSTNVITTVATDNGYPPLSATNSFTLIVTSTNTPAQTVPIYSIIHTNIGGTNGFLLTWFAPSNDLFQVRWTTSLAPPTWTTFTNPPAVSYNTNFPAGPTNAQFNFFDDGSQTGGFGPTRFYRLILLSSGTPNTLTLPAQTNFTVSVSTLVTVTNTATDSNSNAILTYSLLNSPPNASIQTNGIIIWTNAVPAGLAARFTTRVTDNGVPPASATNTFTIFVAPFPAITNVTVTATNTLLTWSAPTNDLFQVQWATNLVPVINWTTFPGIFNSATGIFAFTDTNAPLVVKFYRLLLLP
jgi:subtilisin-like proprotein convertase family protein